MIRSQSNKQSRKIRIGFFAAFCILVFVSNFIACSSPTTIDKARLGSIQKIAIHLRIGQRLTIGSVSYDLPNQFPNLDNVLLAFNKKATEDWLRSNLSEVASFSWVSYSDTVLLYDYIESSFLPFSSSDYQQWLDGQESIKQSLTRNITIKSKNDAILWIRVGYKASMKGSPGAFGDHQGAIHKLRALWSAELFEHSGKKIWLIPDQAIESKEELTFGSWMSERWKTNIGTGIVTTNYQISLDQMAVAIFAREVGETGASKVLRSLLEDIALARSHRAS